MAAVMLSIRPKWCEMIASGKKTIEVRKTRPKLDTPFKCYIYETKGIAEIGHNGDVAYVYHEGRGKVIGEFVCNEIREITTVFRNERGEIITKCDGNIWDHQLLPHYSCLSAKEICYYLGGIAKNGYGWQISELTIYDMARKLPEFNRCEHTGKDSEACRHCRYGPLHSQEKSYCIGKPIYRPPQSWCYVKEVG